METLAKRIVSRWVQRGLIEESQAEWYVYALLERITTLCSFSAVVALGSLFSNVWHAFLFAVALMYLRAYTNGHHAKTYLGCLVNSCIIEILGVLLCTHLNSILSLFLSLISTIIIFSLAPLNNEQIHFSSEEFMAVRSVCHKRIVVLFILHIVLLLLLPVSAYCISLAMSADAFLLLIAKQK